MHNLNQVVADCKQTMDTYQIPYGAMLNVQVSSRMRRTWGSCRKGRDGISTITISNRLLHEDVPLDSLRTTVFHELLHSAPDTSGHKGAWKQYAEALSRITGLNIKRTTSAEEKGISMDENQNPEIKFMCECRKCGLQIVRYRDCKFAHNSHRYRCGRCGGKFKQIINRL